METARGNGSVFTRGEETMSKKLEGKSAPPRFRYERIINKVRAHPTESLAESVTGLTFIAEPFGICSK
jgi:hypothetical protein